MAQDFRCNWKKLRRRCVTCRATATVAPDSSPARLADPQCLPLARSPGRRSSRGEAKPVAFPLKLARLAGVLLTWATLAGCSVTQPVAELTAKAVVTQLPLSVEKGEARRYCREHAAAAHGQQTESARTAALNQEVADFQAMVEESLVYRAETVRLIASVKAAMESKKAIPGKDLTELNDGLAKHLALRKQLYQVAEAHECWLDANGPVADTDAGTAPQGHHDVAVRRAGALRQLPARHLPLSGRSSAAAAAQQQGRGLRHRLRGTEPDIAGVRLGGNTQPGAAGNHLLPGGNRQITGPSGAGHHLRTSTSSSTRARPTA